MNLFFRLMVQIVKNLRPLRQIKVQDEATLSFHALPHDLDCNFHVNNGRYLSFMDVGRIDLINRIGVLWPSIFKGWIPIIGEVKIAYRKPLRPFQKFQLKTKITHWDAKWFYFSQIFESQGRTIAAGTSRGLMRSKSCVIPPTDVLKVIRIKPASAGTLKEPTFIFSDHDLKLLEDDLGLLPFDRCNQ